METIIGRFLTPLNSLRTMRARPSRRNDDSRGRVQNVRRDSSDGWQAWRPAGNVRLVAHHAHCEVHSAADEVTSGGATFVTMVQAADFPEYDHVTLRDA